MEEVCLRIMHLPLTFLTHLSSFLLFLSRNKSQKSFRMKTSTCRDETLKNQLNKMGMTPQHIHTIPTSCAILPTMHNKKTLYTHSLNEHDTQHCSLHSLPHKRQSTSATFISNKVLQHNLNSQHTIPSITAHSFCIQDRLYLPCSVATTLQPPTTCTTHSMHNTLHAHQHAQHTTILPSMHTTIKHKT